MEVRSSVLDFNKVCRLCLSEETVMSSIYSEADNLSSTVPLPLRIMACVSVEVSSTDGLPSQICASCLCQVDGWYKFKDLCENADSLLRKCVKNEPVQVEAISHVSRTLLT
ncbi:UNVERIFIED_CONTAM: hypothetical protein PYX00_003536 [Menopon gallinae]|uniref:ZAD domain-containing protein n=1 Tax=Menopon gallinae TaxID=328185 RepID=A0AAW2I0R3_9NEOP